MEATHAKVESTNDRILNFTFECISLILMQMERRFDDWYSDLLRWTFTRFGVLGLMQRSHLRDPPSRLLEHMGGKHGRLAGKGTHLGCGSG